MRDMRLVSFIIMFVLALLSFGEVRVLSICIGEYPEHSGWNRLNADKDLEHIREVFPQTKSLSDSEATHRNILSALNALEKETAQGDTVIIHFSGHGQQILTEYSSIEPDYVDESLVPYDALKTQTSSYHGEHHLTDDIFGSHITALRQKVGAAGLVVAVIDACHSDSMDKGDDNGVTYRGTDDIFGTEGMSAEKLIALKDRYRGEELQPLLNDAELSDAILIGACKSNQRNYELDSNCGSLTFYFCKSIRETGLSDLTAFMSGLYSNMSADKTMAFHGQQPAIRTTLDWDEPSVPKYIPPIDDHKDPPSPDNDFKWMCIIGGLFAVLLLALVWMKRRK